MAGQDVPFHLLTATMDTFPPTDRSKLVPVSLFLVAFAVRAWGIGYVQFGIDESVASAIATQIAHGSYFPLTGLETSFGFHNPPTLFYLLTPLFALSSDPRFAALFFALLGSCAVLYAWRSGCLLGGARAGLIAALVVAVCPNAVEHSRRLWGHDLMVFFGAMSAWGALEFRHTFSSRYLALSFCAAAVAQTVHLSGALLWVFPLTMALMDDTPGRMKGFVVGAVLLLLLYAPWMASEVGGGWVESRLIGTLLAGGVGRHELGVPVGSVAAWMLVLSDFWTNDLLGAQRPFMLSPVAAAASVLNSAVAVMLLAGALWHAGGTIGNDGRNRAVAGACMAGVLAPLVCFGFLFRASVPPYQLPALIPAVLAVGWGMGTLPSERQRRLAWLCISLYAVSSLALTLETRRQLMNGAGTSIPLAEKMEVVREIREMAGSGPYSLAQDGRHPETGIDVANAYLLYWAGINGMLEKLDGRGPLFVIMDPQSRLRPEVAVFLSSRQRYEFAHLSLFVVDSPEGRSQWRELVERYPGSAP